MLHLAVYRDKLNARTVLLGLKPARTQSLLGLLRNLNVIKQTNESTLCSWSADATLQVANMSQHFKFLSANLQILSRHLLEKPEMLLIGKDVTDASHLVRNVTQVFLIRPDREKIIVL